MEFPLHASAFFLLPAIMSLAKCALHTSKSGTKTCGRRRERGFREIGGVEVRIREVERERERGGRKGTMEVTGWGPTEET
jgi:hypothetical protein